MALLFLDGFDHYTEASDRHLKKWDTESTTSSFAINAATGQNGSKSARFTGGVTLRKNIASTSVLYAGFWFSFGSTSLSSTELLGFYASNGAILASIDYDNGVIFMKGNSSDKIVAPGFNVQSNAGGYYIECKVEVDTLGYMELHIDGELVASRSDINTGSLPCTEIRFGTAGSIGTVDMDDLYVLDDTGTTFNDFLGPIHIETLFPTGTGNVGDWTPSTGPANWQDVDDNPPDDDSTYVSTDVVGEVDLYGFGNLSATSGTILGVQLNVYARKDSASARAIKFAARSGTTTNSTYGTGNLSDSYLFRRTLLETNPDTLAAWTITNVNSAEFGMKLNS